MELSNTTKKTLATAAGILALSATGTASAYSTSVGDSTVSIYGYAKLDVIYDVDNELGNSVMRGAPLLDGQEGSRGHTTMHAYQSRIGFSTSTPLKGSELKTRIEGDFYGGGGGELRLRHAYGEWRGILAGQTWTNFTSFIATTPTIDFTGVGGQPLGHRQAQLRYTSGNFSVAIEDPKDRGGEVDAIGAKSQLPDVTVRYTDRSGPIKYSTSAVGRYLEYDSAGLATPQDSDNTFGWGIALEGSSDLTDSLTVRGGVTHGQGIGGYMNGAVISSPAFVDSDGDLQAIEATGGTIGASLALGEGDLNVAYSLISADIPDSYSQPSKNEEFNEAWINYIWSPAENVKYGIEASWHKRETVDGRSGDATRLQGMVMYSF